VRPVRNDSWTDFANGRRPSPGDQVTAWVDIVPGSASESIGFELGENIDGGVRVP
jgi:hypothetical protein